jgi:hypothetical protein
MLNAITGGRKSEIEIYRDRNLQRWWVAFLAHLVRALLSVRCCCSVGEGGVLQSVVCCYHKSMEIPEKNPTADAHSSFSYPGRGFSLLDTIAGLCWRALTKLGASPCVRYGLESESCCYVPHMCRGISSGG